MIRLAFNLFPNMLDKSVFVLFAFNARQSIKLISWVVLLCYSHNVANSMAMSAGNFSQIIWNCCLALWGYENNNKP